MSAAVRFQHAGRKSTPVTLSLFACLGELPPYRESGSSYPEILCWANTDWPGAIAAAEFDFVDLPEGLNVSAASYYALSTPAAFRDIDPADATVLFVDGSAVAQAAAWSVVRVDYDSAGVPAFQGCIAGPVHLNEMPEAWIGAESIDNIAASCLLLEQR